MSREYQGRKESKEWCLVYREKYVLDIGSWYRINRRFERIPDSCYDEYRILHISVCQDLINAIEVKRHEI